MPLEKICEYSTHKILSFITFSTPSGRIRAYLIENYFEISEELRKLLNKKQDDEEKANESIIKKVLDKEQDA